MAAAHPNVILLVFDAARADAFEPWGAAPGSSPAVAQLASRGSAAARATATACWTVPSHSSIFTGLLPRASGLIRAPGGRPAGCRPVLESLRERLLAEVMRANGYRTAAVSTNLWLTRRSGFSLGFDDFRVVETHRQTELGSGGPRPRLRRTREALRARVDDGAEAAAEIFEGWITDAAGARDRPFFWFANLVEAHSPYLPPKPYNPLGPVDRMRAASEAAGHLTMSEIWRACAGGGEPRADALERMRELYAGAIRYLDDWLATLCRRLDQAGLLEDTLLIVTSDHGEHFGEDGMMGHAFSLSQRLLHVPLVWAGPGAGGLPGPVSLARLPELVAAAAGLERNPYGRSGEAGPAVAQFDPPAGPGDPRVGEALSAWGLGPEAAPRLTTSMTAAVGERWKLLRRGDEERFYDLDDDPGETAPLTAAETGADPGTIASLRAAVEAAGEAADGGGAPAGGEDISEAERERLEAQMRLLGYL